MSTMMSSNIKVRFANDADSATVSEFVFTALNDSSILRGCSEHIGSEFLNRLETEKQNLLLATDTQNDNSIIGFLEIDLNRSINNQTYFIANIYVLPQYRRKGIASILVQTMLQEKCTHGEELVVEATSEQERKYWDNLHFYTKSMFLNLKL